MPVSTPALCYAGNLSVIYMYIYIKLRDLDIRPYNFTCCFFSLDLKGENKLKVFGYPVPRNIIEPRTDVVKKVLEKINSMTSFISIFHLIMLFL